jgi:hypothetical protein
VRPQVGCPERETRAVPLGGLRPCPRSGGRRSEGPAARRSHAVTDFLDGVGVVVEPHASTGPCEGREPGGGDPARSGRAPVLPAAPLAPLRPALLGRGTPSDRGASRAPRSRLGSTAVPLCGPAPSTAHAPARGRAGRDAERGDLPHLRKLLRRSATRGALRVAHANGRAERPVPGPVPDGLDRTPAVRPWLLRRGASARGVSILRLLGERLEPLVVQAVNSTDCGEPCEAFVDRARPARETSANCGPHVGTWGFHGHGRVVGVRGWPG